MLEVDIHTRRLNLLTVSIVVMAGFVFRLWLVSLFPHEIIADQKTYLQFAQEIKERFWVAECCTRGFVYPMFLSLLFELFGNKNLFAVTAVQSALDSVTGIMLFFISFKLFRNLQIAFMTLSTYIFNPLTSSYTGLILTEILILFLVILTLLLLLAKDNFIFRLGVGVTVGLIMFSRLTFFYWGIALVVVLFLYHLYSSSSSIKNILPMVLGIFLVTIYPSLANWLTNKTISPLPVVPAWRYDYLISFKVDRWPSLLEEYYRELDPIIKRDYQINFNDRGEFIRETDRRIKEAHAQVLRNPFGFIVSRIRHIFIFWDKSSLFYYKDPFFPEDRPWVRIGNIIFLFLSGLGIFNLLRYREKTSRASLALLFSLVLVVYLTFALTFRVPEERHSLPAYPVLVLYFPIGVTLLLNFIRNRNRSLKEERT